MVVILVVEEEEVVVVVLVVVVVVGQGSTESIIITRHWTTFRRCLAANICIIMLGEGPGVFQTI